MCPCPLQCSQLPVCLCRSASRLCPCSQIPLIIQASAAVREAVVRRRATGPECSPALALRWTETTSVKLIFSVWSVMLTTGNSSMAVLGPVNPRKRQDTQLQPRHTNQKLNVDNLDFIVICKINEPIVFKVKECHVFRRLCLQFTSFLLEFASEQSDTWAWSSRNSQP